MAYPIIKPTLPDFSEVEADFRQIWASGMLTTNRVVRELEAMTAELCQVEHCVAVANCTSGLLLLVKALGLTGEVILPSFTFAATGHALVWNGIEPVFVDSLPGTMNIDPEAARAAITERTTAILGVYVFGLPPQMDALESLAAEHKLELIFDAAQGLGATWQGKPAGGFGHGEVFSMSPTKVVTAAEGGLITTHDGHLAQVLRQMRDYGKGLDGYNMEFIGVNARQSEFNAAVGKASLRHLDQYMGHRLAMIARYQEALRDLPGVSFQEIPAGFTSSGNYMVMRVNAQAAKMSRDALYDALGEREIQTKKYFYPPLHMHQAYLPWRARYEGRLPVAEQLSQEGIALPLYGHIQPADCDIIIGAVRELLG
jgi:dTDP-4-amino-4,6-dideoxygalactose transaminase